MAPVKWFILAAQFLSIVRLPNVKADQRDLRASIVFYPMVGLLSGSVMWLVQWLLSTHLPRLPASVLTVAAYTLLSGALHLDGLMDTADGLGSRQPRARALEIMKDSRVGAMGVVAGGFALLGKVAAVDSLSPNQWVPFLVIPMLARMSMVWSMRFVRPARPGGLGALFARNVPWWGVTVATAYCLIVCTVVPDYPTALIAMLAAVIITWLFCAFMARRFGGMTGDLYGALNESVEWIVWFVWLWCIHW